METLCFWLVCFLLSDVYELCARLNVKLRESHFSFHADLLKKQTPLDAFVLFWLFSNLQAS